VAIALVQSITGNGATLTLNGVASGNLLTLQDSYFRGTSTGIAEAVPTDTNGTWSVASAGVPGIFSGKDNGSGIFYQAAVAAGTHTVTPQANSDHNATLCEWSGAISSPLDVAANASTNAFTGTSQVTGTTAATAQNDEISLIVLGLAANIGVTDVGFTDPVSGYTTIQKVSNDLTTVATFHAYKVLTAAGAQSATFNWTDTEADQFCGAAIATFKAAAVITYGTNPTARDLALMESTFGTPELLDVRAWF
jgi:hypothetical protein